MILRSSDSSSDGLLSAGDFTTVSEVLDPQNFATAFCNRAHGLTVRWFVCKDQIPTLTGDWCQIFTNVVVADRIREAHIHKPLGTIRPLPGPFDDGHPTPSLPYPDRWVFDKPRRTFPHLTLTYECWLRRCHIFAWSQQVGSRVASQWQS